MLTEKPDLVKIVIAWTNLSVRRVKELTESSGDSESDSWEWLWGNTTYSLKELKDKIGLSLSEVALENRIKPLIGNRIIYPDSTVNSFVERYLREQVVKLFEVKQKRCGRKD